MAAQLGPSTFYAAGQLDGSGAYVRKGMRSNPFPLMFGLKNVDRGLTSNPKPSKLMLAQIPEVSGLDWDLILWARLSFSPGRVW